MTRPFRGLPISKGPEARYDVVVIGAGIAGLVLANLLVKQGMKILLVEAHYMVGGYCSTFHRKGFTFDAASHFYPLLGNPETVTGRLMQELGIEQEWVKMDPVDHFHFPDGTHFKVDADLDRYLASLTAAFPHQVTQIETFFARVKEAYTAGLLGYFRGCKSRNFVKYQQLTLADVLNDCFSDRKLRLLLSADSPHWGGPPSRTSFLFDSMLRLSYFLGNYYPRGGSQHFADQLAAVFERRGGHILTKSSVERICIEGGRVVGVELQTGPMRSRQLQRVAASRVAACGDLLHTLRHLIGEQHLDPAWLAEVTAMKPTYPCFLCHLGLRDIDAAQLAQVQGYYWDDWEPDTMGRDGLKFKLFVPTLFEPAMAPPGCHVLIIQKVIEMDYDAVEDWHVHKHGVERYMMAEMEQLIPGFASKVVVMASATAATSARFTGNYQGAMLGWEMSPEQLGEARPDIVTPIEGLYFSGHWTRPGGGITPVIVSAENVARLIERGCLR